MINAREIELVGCHVCGVVHETTESRCRRCSARLHSRLPHSVQNAWAWLIAGIVFYIPANLYPLLANRLLGSEEGHTIVEGIIIFFEKGDYFVATVIMTASLLIPISKIAIIAYLLASIQFKWRHDAHSKLLLYEFVEFVGRWSMIDVFVVALLAGLVQLGAIVTIVPGIGAVCFAMSVILTMASAQAIDSKLIWDVVENEGATHNGKH